ncbi:MAG: reverse transcriptase-like protein [Candidatus Peribacteria bacterium]|nr:reverse transcriptase-like protein [Candidatus Peribacteria bacterium]
MKKSELGSINNDIKKLIQKNKIEITFNWIPREKNKEADRLSNIAMDEAENY